jgi:long-chain fatty acid transport protein
VGVRHVILLGAALALLGARAMPAAASAVDLFGYGLRGIALGGALVSQARGHEAIYYNPAGLAHDTRPSFALGFQMAHFDLRVNGIAREARDAPALVLGFAVPVPLGGLLEHRLALGLGLVLPSRSVLIADIPRPGSEQFTLVENRAQTVSLQGALAVRLLDELVIGGGFLALARLDGGVQVAPNATGSLGSRLKSELVAEFAPVVGFQVLPTPWIGAGLVFRGESRAAFTYPIQADFGDQFPLPIPVLDVSGTAQYDPAQLSFDVSGRPIPELSLALAFTYKFWSGFGNPIVYTAVPPSDPPQPLPGFEDTLVVRGGAEGYLSFGDWVLRPRLGYVYEPTPVPDQTGFHNYLDNDRHVFGFGVSVGWRMLRLDLGGQVHHLVPRTSTKDPAEVSADEANPGYPSIQHQGRIVVWGLEAAVDL